VGLTVSTRGRYGVRLMTALAMDYGKGIRLLSDVSRQEGISGKYLGQIVIPLRNAGLVVSQRGAHGGYALGRPPESITVKDVLEAIEGRVTPVPCVGDEGACARHRGCSTAEVWSRLRDDIESSLSSFTLADLARKARDRGDRLEEYSI
jgi:Rrf2 family protein